MRKTSNKWISENVLVFGMMLYVLLYSNKNPQIAWATMLFIFLLSLIIRLVVLNKKAQATFWKGLQFTISFLIGIITGTVIIYVRELIMFRMININ